MCSIRLASVCCLWGIVRRPVLSMNISCCAVVLTSAVLMQVPSNMIAGKTRFPGVYICIAMCLWGVISACTAAVHSFTGLVLSRFFLGFVEAAFFPGALFYLSLFYNRQQFAFRTAILYSGSQLGNAFGGLFAIAILKLDGTHGLEGWRWVSGSISTNFQRILTFNSCS
jgi:MFS family permease